MRQLNEKLDVLRRELGYTYEDVQEKLEARGVHVTPAAVGHWFNGTRKPRSMKHLMALCSVLNTSIAAIVGDDIEIVESAKEQVILKQFRAMSPEQQAALLALAATMTPYPTLDVPAKSRHTVHEPKPRGYK